MLVLLPVLALGTYSMAFKACLPRWREAILGGAVACAVVLVAITESLSGLHQLTVYGLAVAWCIALVPGMALLARVSRNATPRFSWPAPRLDVPQLLLLVPLAVLLGVLAAVALLSPPNTWDSMTYHMARLIHWQQSGSLDPYPTHILRQLYLQPGAELILLHLQLLSGGDALAGLLQWASMLGALMGASLVANDLGAHRPGTLCATLFAASVPIGILESTSTQNDYVVAFWLVCMAVFALRLVASPPAAMPWPLAIGFGASVGMALLTKATAYLVSFPMLVWVTTSLLLRRRWRGVGIVGAAGAIALALNAGFYARNLSVFGSPFGPPDEGAPAVAYLNAGFSPVLVVSNVVRNLGLNVVATPFPVVNATGLAIVQAVHAWLGVDIADPRSTWGQETFRQQPAGLAFDNNFAGNPLHMVLILVAAVSVWPLRRALGRAVIVYAAVLASGFLLFCIVLRWQPWHTRLELPFFVLGAPLVGVVAERIGQRLATPLAVTLLASMLPWVVYNQASPLVGPRSILAASRDNQYFTNQPDLGSAYLGAIGLLVSRGCSRVGFVSSGDGWEYPLWALLGRSGSGAVEIEHVGVSNVSAALATPHDRQFEPCAVFSIDTQPTLRSLDLANRTYQLSWAQERIAVLTIDGR
ncbi:MAG: hypothetical protein M3069_05345 [Chloroflexota bacterium]|nr:hypothetical protein [Chloroflexota bacterium]